MVKGKFFVKKRSLRKGSSMYKEIWISIAIVIIVSAGDIVSNNYTKNSVKDMSASLNEIRYELEKNEKDENIIKNIMADINQKWRNKNEKLSFYIEHDELEKVETELYALNANVDTKDYEQAIEKIEKCKFILKHIENKEGLSLKNIF